MTTERIDVLAVLDFHLSTRDGGLPGSMYANEHARLSEARAAVAELIERVEYLCRTGEGMIALRAALARVSGGAA